MPLLAAGTHTHYNDSMAQAIENAFLAEWPNIMTGQPAPIASEQMRLLFMAIAQGVVQHLVKHPEAFAITFTEGGITRTAKLIISQDNAFTTQP